MIAEERQRQIEKEGWDSSHDEQHTDESLALAAICYATPANKLRMVTRSGQDDVSGGRGDCPVWGSVHYLVPKGWPDSWHPVWWSPGHNLEPNRIRDLVKAGALIAAEIDRLVRDSA